MRNKILGGALVLVIAAIATFNIYLNTKKDNMSLLVLANVEALAKDDEGAPGASYTRVASDCVITIKGKAGSSVTLPGLGTVKLDHNGEYTYTRVKGEVRCIGGGGEMCIPQNC